jgi:hypothetical protein
MKMSKYVANLSEGTRVRLMGLGHHPKRGYECTVIGVLPNPSRRAEHQWYDVRFDDNSFGRFLEKYLVETQEIPPREWPDLFGSFSHRHEYWLVHMEIFDRETAAQITSRMLRLKSITTEGPMIVVVGEDVASEVSQLIRAPSRVLLTRNKKGVDEGIEEEGIEIDAEKNLLVLRFRSAVLPEVVDGWRVKLGFELGDREPVHAGGS